MYENVTASESALKMIEASKIPSNNLTIQDIVAKAKIVLETCNKDRMYNLSCIFKNNLIKTSLLF